MYSDTWTFKILHNQSLFVRGHVRLSATSRVAAYTISSNFNALFIYSWSWILLLNIISSFVKIEVQEENIYEEILISSKVYSVTVKKLKLNKESKMEIYIFFSWR